MHLARQKRGWLQGDSYKQRQGYIQAIWDLYEQTTSHVAPDIGLI